MHATQKGNSTLGCIKRSITSRSREVSPSGVPSSALGLPAQERHRPVGVGPEMSHKDDQRAGVCLQWKHAEWVRIFNLQLFTLRMVKHWNRLKIPENITDETGWSFEKAGVVGGVRVHGREVGTKQCLKSNLNHVMFLWFIKLEPRCTSLLLTSAIQMNDLLLNITVSVRVSNRKSSILKN